MLNTNTKPKQDKFAGTGIYRLNCSSCDKFYVGQTGRPFTKRYKEHIQALKHPEKSKFAEHLVNCDHAYKNIDNNMEIIQKCIKGNYMNRVEEYHIYKNELEQPDELLNDKKLFDATPTFELISQLSKFR